MIVAKYLFALVWVANVYIIDQNFRKKRYWKSTAAMIGTEACLVALL